MQIDIYLLPSLNIIKGSFQTFNFLFEYWKCWGFWQLLCMVSTLGRNYHLLCSLNLRLYFAIFISRIWIPREELRGSRIQYLLLQQKIFLSRLSSILRCCILYFFLLEPIVLLIKSNKVGMPLFAFYEGLLALLLFVLDWFLQKWHMIFHPYLGRQYWN